MREAPATRTRATAPPAWVVPARAAAPVPKPAPVPPPPTSAWDAVHRWAATGDVSTAGAVRDGLARAGTELPAWCRPRCHAQLAELARDDPPPPGDRAAVCRHVLAWQNRVRSRLSPPKPAVAYAAAAERYGWPVAVHVHQSANGVGDAIHAYYAACGLAEATGEAVVLHAQFDDWLARMSHPGVTVVDRAEAGPDLNGATGQADREGNYRRQVASAASRTAVYCANAAAGLSLPPFAARRPARVDREIRLPADFGGPYVVLVPYSHHRGREWPRPKWTELARQLVAVGLTPVAIDSNNALRRKQLAEDFGGVAGTLTVSDRDASGVADLMLGAECVVALDSGGAHIAGMLGVPTVAVHAGSLPHSFLFDLSPSVSSVTPGRSLPRADQNEAALATVTVDAVLAEVLRRVGVWPKVSRLPPIASTAPAAE